jgi:hypothetical protein
VTPTPLKMYSALGALALLAALVTVVGGRPAAAAAASWGTPTSIDSPHNGGLDSVACPTTTWCAAVSGGDVLTFSDGTWRKPRLIDSYGSLTSVSCPTTAFCMAVDTAGHVVTYDGSAWSTPSDVDSSYELTSVSCPTVSFCVAVDYAATQTSDTGDALTWKGGKWSTPDDILSPGFLGAVRCTSTTFCVAVGWNDSQNASGGDASLTFNGTKWTSVTVGAYELPMDAVSCVSTTFCVAGDGAGNGYIFNGRTWSETDQVIPPYVTYSGSVSSISCTSSSYCVAVGSNGDNGADVATYDGSGWSRASTIDSYTDGFGAATAASVSCPTNSLCVTVSGADAVTYRDGTWAAPQHLQNDNNLSSVSCPTTTSCTAVDFAGHELVHNGTDWSAPVGIDDFADGDLTSLSCPSTTFCAAVDYNGNALIYEGTSWSKPASIDPGNSLVGVSCPTTNFCVAVDDTGNAFTYGGTSWSAPASIASGALVARSVSCPTATFCVAGGEQLGGTSGDAVAVWNGSTWSQVTDLNGGKLSFPYISSVSCPTTTFCAAVDIYGSAFTYNGSSWSGPVVIDFDVQLASVSCQSSKFCAAVDQNDNAYVYDGTSWTGPTHIDASSSPENPGPPVSEPALSCPAANLCIAVDQHGDAVVYGVTSSSTTTTHLSLARDGLVYGDESAETFSVAVSAASHGAPTGTVDVKAGSLLLCAAKLSSSGTGSCKPSATRLNEGTEAITASYLGSSGFDSSVSSPSSLVIAKATTTTKLGLFPTATTYGKEAAVRFSVSVVPTYAGVPKGSVKIRAGTVTLCTITLSSGAGSCAGSGTALAAGTHAITASYGGATNFDASVSSESTLTIVKASSATTFSLSTTKVTYGKESVEVVSGAVTSVDGGTAAGTVEVKAGSLLLCKMTLSGGKGKCSMSATALSPGTYVLEAVYLGSTDYDASTSVKQSLVVGR